MRTCRRCPTPLESDALTCPNCHTLVYEDELTRLRAEALAHEAAGRFASAKDEWIRALSYLPHNTRQATWVLGRIGELQGAADTTPDTPHATPKWIARVGPLAPIALLLFKGKGLLALFNAKSLISLGAFMGIYGQQFGWRFGVGFGVLILIHELGHYVDIRRRGLPADMPVFLPGLGAYVRWQAIGVSKKVKAEVSLAGPLAGLGASVACAVIWWLSNEPIWAALARASAWLNVLNLIPVWALDGGQAANALDRSERTAILTTALLLWITLSESVFLLVAGGALWRVFARDLPDQPSRSTAAYFLAVLALLGVTMYLMPGTGAGTF